MNTYHGGTNDPADARFRDDPADPSADRTFGSCPLRLVESGVISVLPPRTALVLFNREHLERHPHFRGRTALVHVEMQEDTIVLSGRLPSHHLKQLLQEAVLQISDTVLVENRVTVMRPSP